MITRILGPISAVVALTACGPAEVPWGDYAPSVKADIDHAASARDCVGLQRMFDDADANNASTLRRTGHNNAALMDYIDKAEVTARCHS